VFKRPESGVRLRGGDVMTLWCLSPISGLGQFGEKEHYYYYYYYYYIIEIRNKKVIVSTFTTFITRSQFAS